MLTQTQSAVFPATVEEIVAGRLRLRTPAGEAWAQLALAYPYQPEPGDTVLAIGENEIYVIGVLFGHGKTVFQAPGDLELNARGRVSLRGGEGIRLQGPEIDLRADRVEITARTVVEKLITCYRWVKDVVQTVAGRKRTIIEGESMTKANRIVAVAEKDVKIDGTKILLG